MAEWSHQTLVILIHMLEWMGIAVIAVTAIRVFVMYILRYLDFNDDNVKLVLAKGLAVGLEFKLGSEILKTVMLRTLDEILILGSVVILRVVLTYVIYWEIRAHEERELKKNGLA